MNTEITDTKNEDWVFYDGECPLCLKWMQRCRPVLQRRDFQFEPLQTERVRTLLGMSKTETPKEMVVLTRDNRRFGGANAIVYLASRVWWAQPFYWLAHIPGTKRLLRFTYETLAVRRYCITGNCSTRPANGRTNGWIATLPLIIFPALSFAARPFLPVWAFMWLLAFAMFFGCKWLTLRDAGTTTATFKRKIGYLLFWIGMDAKRFLRDDNRPEKPQLREWIEAIAKTCLGSALVWGVARYVPADKPLLVGWTGLFGSVFLLHFGSFHLLALAWQRSGVAAEPIMHAPARATSLTEFWSQRWNRGFQKLAHHYVFKPLHRHIGIRAAMFLVFVLSGLIHDAVISVPARGGYGLPTIYFALQGLGILIERSGFARIAQLDRDWRGWFFTVIITAGPVFWLFHPPFITNVILPFMKAIHAI